MKNIDILKDVKKIDTIETKVTQNTTDITSIQNDLSLTENTKYTTVNGVKEFECGNGYVDNIVIEGQTLVNLGEKSVNNFTLTVNTSKNIVSYNFKPNTEYTLILEFYDNATTSNNPTDLYFVQTELYGNCNLSGVEAKGIVARKIITSSNPPTFWNIGTRGTFVGSVSVKNFMILEGDYTQNPPSYFEGLKSVGQGDKIEVLISSEKTIVKNLSQADYVLGGISGTDGTLQDWNDWQSTKDFMEIYDTDKVLIINNPSYIKDIGVAFYNNEKTFINFATGEDFVNFIPIVKDTKYIKVRIKKNANSIIENFTTTIYSTNQYDKKQILTTLRSLPNGVKDIVYKQGDKYYKVKRCEEVVLNGGENWLNNTNPTTIGTYRYQLTGGLPNGGCDNTPTTLISDKLICSAWNETLKLGISASGSSIFLYNSEKATLSDLKKWLQSNPITIAYPLATPVIEEIPNFNPRTFSDKTTILLNSGTVQSEASFEVTNSIRNELEVLKGKVSDLDDYASDDTVEVINITPLNGIRVGGNGVCRLVKTKNTTKFVAELVSDVNIPTGTIICKLPSINKFIPIFAHCIDNKVYRCWLYDDNYLKVYGTTIPANTVFYFNVELI